LAEKENHPAATYELGLLYLKHDDVKKAEQYFFKAAAIGDRNASYQLGKLHGHGRRTISPEKYKKDGGSVGAYVFGWSQAEQSDAAQEPPIPDKKRSGEERKQEFEKKLRRREVPIITKLKLPKNIKER
jgi:hypothetical protein